MLHQFLSKKSLIFVLVGMLFFADLCAAKRGIHGDGQRWGFSYPGFVPQEVNRMQQRIEQISSINEQLAKISPLDTSFTPEQRELYKQRLEGARAGLIGALHNQDLAAFKQTLEYMKLIDEQLAGMNASSNIMSSEQQNQQRDALVLLRNKMINALNNDNEYGRAIAMGLAGDDWKAIQGENIQSIGEGIKLGGLMRVSRACSDVLGKRIENSIDYVLGGAWDALLNSMINGWNITYEGLFHSGEEPFTLRQIRGWQDMIKVTIDDLERLLKDGLRDSLRGHDMTLRTAQDEEVSELQLNAWRLLVSGYIRQFDYVISCIDRSVKYYEGHNDVVQFYAQELKLRILEINQLLSQSSSLKELDAFLDSNKALVPALRKNILNLFARLIEAIEPVTFSAATSTRRTMPSDSNTRSNARNSTDEEEFPNSYRPW